MTGQQLRLALDQNFPIPLLDAVQDFLPHDVLLDHLARIDPKLSRLADDELVLALAEAGYDGMVTNDYSMLNDASVLAAVIARKFAIVAVEKLGHDPIRGVGALLLELPGLCSRLLPRRPNVVQLRHHPRQPVDAWEVLAALAARQGVSAQTLWESNRPAGRQQEGERPSGNTNADIVAIIRADRNRDQ